MSTVSIRDRDEPRPVTITPDNSDNLVLPLIVLIVIIVIVVWMLILLITSGFETSSAENPVTGDNRAPEETPTFCPPGQCATNLLSGFKTCPTNSADGVPVDPSSEVCNDAEFCNNPLTPFAVQSDGSTNIDGVCETGTQCRCLRTLQCPEYVLSAFTTRNGNPYLALDGQRLTFPQTSNYVDGNGQVINTPPIQYSDPGTTFCSAPLAWLPLTSPGCNFVNAERANSMSYDDLVVCMGLPSGCNGAVGNACASGTLAIITNDPESLTQDNIVRQQYGCVRGTPCPCDQVAVYDTEFGAIICRQLPSS